ncbi:GNAT family N-acetyltransferase [Flagellimonas sp.]|uniref:GNAT family N-acetyltransferase n=1 Tax=Flagellimonas sp. TaxID=2058762 RepID=UPI003BA929E4
MKIRRATEADATSIALLGRVTFTETFGHLFKDKTDLLDYYNRTFAVEKLANSLQKNSNAYWLAHINGLPVGYAKLKLHSPSPFIDSKNVCQLQKIYVLKDFLSQKVGLALQTELLQKAQSDGFEHIWLSVLKENKRAIAFYEKNGFAFLGSHSFQIGAEHFEFHAMGKKLL